MKKATFILDIDGVLLNQFSTVYAYILSKHHIEITDRNIVAWSYPYALGLPPEEKHALWDYIWEYPQHPYPGAVAFVRELQDKGFNTVGVSHRPKNWKGLKNPRAAYEAGLRDIPALCLDDVRLCDSPQEKIDTINEVMPKAVYSLEDNPDNAGEIGRKTDCQSFLINRAYNEGCISVTHSWQRVCDYAFLLGIISESENNL